ncbi:MAG: hypothetical protein ACI94Y_003366 [Maribacter sp.]|jgi:hypothetical protein
MIMEPKIYFIVGLQRSGTTLLSVLLGQHPDILMENNAIGFRIITCFKNLYTLLPHNIGIDENEFLEWLIENDEKGRLAELLDYKNIAEYSNIRKLVEGSIYKKLEQNNKKVWGDKSPNLQHFMGDLMLLIPNAKIIHIVRDGRSNAYSMSRRSYKNLSLCAQKWVDGNIFGIVNQHILGKDNYQLVQYENLLLQPEKELQSICDFLDIPFTTEMLDLSNQEIAEDKKYVKSSLIQSKIDDWKRALSKKETEQIEKIQGPLLKKMGYELTSNITEFKLLSLRKQIFYNQVDNFKQLFRRKSIGMKNKEKIVMERSFKNRAYEFITVLTRDLLSLKIFKSLFSRYFYREKYFKKKD